jgi:hypothetical protein
MKRTEEKPFPNVFERFNFFVSLSFLARIYQFFSSLPPAGPIPPTFLKSGVPFLTTEDKTRDRGLSAARQGCQMVCFKTKNSNLGKFWRALLRKISVYFMTIWYILRPLEIFYGHLLHFEVIWYISPVLVFWTEKNLATPLLTTESFS